MKTVFDGIGIGGGALEQALEEITVDNFAGGGGASTGIAMGLGREIDIAINHNQEALDMHARNHPGTTHLCESVFDIDLRMWEAYKREMDAGHKLENEVPA